MKIQLSMRKVVGLAIIIIGICAAAYPLYTDWRAEQAQTDLLQQLAAQNPGVEAPINGSAQVSATVGDAAPMMVLEIPKLKVHTAVVKGTGYSELKNSPGWYPQSALPGVGNTAIAGHRTMYGAWFHNLNELQAGDVITLDYKGALLTYNVEKVFVVANNDWSVIDPTQKPSLTLTTCNPIGSAKQRLVVRAGLVQTGSGG